MTCTNPMIVYKAVPSALLDTIGELERVPPRGANSTIPHLWPTGSSISVSTRNFSSNLSDFTSRLTPCLSFNLQQSTNFDSYFAASTASSFVPVRDCDYRYAPTIEELPLTVGYGAHFPAFKRTVTFLINALSNAHYPISLDI